MNITFLGGGNEIGASVHGDKRMVAVKVGTMPAPEELAGVCEKYDEMTGFKLSVST